MNILALDTATEACSVALLREDGEQFSEFEIQPRAHTRLLPQMLERVLADAAIARQEISHVAYSNGPGAFTGVRIGVASAQGLAFGLGARQIPISTLCVLAQQAHEQHGYSRVLAALDARMGEAYAGLFGINGQGLMQAKGEEQLLKLSELQLPDHCHGAGSGFSAAQAVGIDAGDRSRINSELWPTASAVLQLAERAARNSGDVEIEAAGINYIRDKVAQKSADRTKHPA